MGRQTYFVMSEEDEKVFLEFLNQDRTVKVVMEYTPTPDLSILDVFPKIGPKKFIGYLWDATNSPPPVAEFIPRQNYYLVDEERSELIEFCRSLRLEAGKMDEGRVYIRPKAYIDGELIPRPKYFLDWYDKVARWIRKNGVRKHDISYVFPDAARLIDEEGYQVGGL